MRVVCDCGNVLYDQPMPAPGLTRGGDHLSRVVAMHVDTQLVKPGECQLDVTCLKCGRTLIRVENNARPITKETP